MQILRQFRVLILSCVILFALGVCIAPLKKLAEQKSVYPELQNSASENFVFGILGGYRPIIADFIWLGAYCDWEKEDVSGCIANIDFASKLNPSARIFWHMGANMIAYDTPNWIIKRDKLSGSLINHIKRRQGALAIDFLDRGLKALPKSRQLLLDKAFIYDKNFNDKLSALECIALANDDTAPMYIVRNHSSALEELGRFNEAIDVLKKALPRFNPDHPATQIYKEHIAFLENKLKSRKN